MPRTPSVRARPAITGLSLLALLGVLLAGVFAGGGASAQPLPLTRSMTASHDSLQPGALITYTVTLTNPDVAEQGTSLFVFADAELTFVPAGSDPRWVLNAPAIQVGSVLVPAGGTVVLPLVVQVGAVADTKTVLGAALEVLGNTNLQLDIPILDVGVTTVAEINNPSNEPRPGDTLLHRHTVTNRRGFAINTTLTNVVPAGTTFSAVGSDALWSCPDGSVAGTVCTRALGLGASGSGGMLFNVRIDTDHPAALPIRNVASLPTLGDLNPADNTSVVETAVVALETLSISMRGASGSLEAGARITYTVTLDNPATVAQTVTVQDEPDVGTTTVLAPANPVAGIDSDPAWTFDLASIFSFRETIVALGSRDLILVVEVDDMQVDEDALGFVNTVRILTDTGAEIDSASVVTPVNDVGVVMTVNPASISYGLRLFPSGQPVYPGDHLVYQHTVTNFRDVPIETTLTHVVPAGTMFYGFYSDDEWSCSDLGGAPEAGTVCDLPVSLGPGQVKRVGGYYVVRVDQFRTGAAPIISEASLPTLGDRNPGNNRQVLQTPLIASNAHVFVGETPGVSGVVAHNQDGLQVGSSGIIFRSPAGITVAQWRIDIPPEVGFECDLNGMIVVCPPSYRIRNLSVTFAAIDPPGARTNTFTVTAGARTEVTLSGAPPFRPTNTWVARSGVELNPPTDGANPIPVVTATAIDACTENLPGRVFCLDGNGTAVFASFVPPPPILPRSVYIPSTTPATNAGPFTGGGTSGVVSGTQFLGGCEWGFAPCNGLGRVDRLPSLGVAQANPPFFDAPVQMTGWPGPLPADPAGLQWVLVEQDRMTAIPTTVDYEAGTATASVERQGTYTLLLGFTRDLALPAGTAALGFHGAPGTPPALLQGQLADPSALQVMFQFRDGAWLIYRPSGPSILNSLRGIDASAPLFLSLSRATRWAGPLLFLGDRDVPVASGFTAVTYTGLDAVTPEELLAQFANPGAVSAIFLFDNTLGEDRTFRAAGPSVLNDLDLVQPFDVFFVLAERATSLSIPEG